MLTGSLPCPPSSERMSRNALGVPFAQLVQAAGTLIGMTILIRLLERDFRFNVDDANESALELRKGHPHAGGKPAPSWPLGGGLSTARGARKQAVVPRTSQEIAPDQEAGRRVRCQHASSSLPAADIQDAQQQPYGEDNRRAGQHIFDQFAHRAEAQRIDATQEIRNADNYVGGSDLEPHHQ